MEKKLLLVKSLVQTCYFGLKDQRNMASLIGSISLISLFDFLFYSQKFLVYGLGLNLLIMTVITLATAISLYQPALNNKVFWWAVFGCMFSAFNVWYNSDAWALIMFFISYFLVVGSLQNNLKNVLFVFIQWIFMQISAPFYTIFFLAQAKNWHSNTGENVWKITKLIALPLTVSAAFIGMYAYASEPFYKLIVEPFSHLFKMERLDYGRIFIWILAAGFILPLLIPMVADIIKLKPNIESKTIKRNRKKVKALFKMLDLNNELKISSFTLIALNFLVFLFNTLDLIHVWFGNSLKTAAELSQYVHEGTNMVMLSITIGLAILLFIFRDKLNFHPKNKTLLLLSFGWLIQNAFLAISTLVRNLHYVNEFGLTFKRLGLVIFVVSILVALLIIYQKINEKHSLHHFANRISLAIYIILIGFSIVDHERLIILHAVHFQQKNVDLKYLNQISINHDFIIQKHLETLNNKSHQNMIINDAKTHFTESKSWRAHNILEHINDRKTQGLAFSVIKKNTIPEVLSPKIEAQKIDYDCIQVEPTLLTLPNR